MEKLVLKNISRKYGEIEAVKDFSLSINDGEFVVLVGPSGCGKSTTLRMIAGLEEISSGEIYLENQFLNNIIPANRDIAMVFQNYALYPHMTVYKNMAFGLKMRKFSKSFIQEKILEVSKTLAIEQLLERYPKELSGGQRQRVALGRAIVRNPKVFLFDEPLSNLDAKLRAQTRVELLKLHKQLSSTSVYVTHDQVEAMTMGDRIVVMLDGSIQQVGTPMELYLKPVNQFVASFIGSPQMNFATGTLMQRDDEYHFCSAAISLPLPKNLNSTLEKYSTKKIILGIRPENLLIEENTNTHYLFCEKIEVIERVGSDNYLNFTHQSKSMIARVPPKLEIKTNLQIDFYVDHNAIHIFDETTGLAIL